MQLIVRRSDTFIHRTAHFCTAFYDGNQNRQFFFLASRRLDNRAFICNTPPSLRRTNAHSVMSIARRLASVLLCDFSLLINASSLPTTPPPPRLSRSKQARYTTEEGEDIKHGMACDTSAHQLHGSPSPTIVDTITTSKTRNDCIFYAPIYHPVSAAQCVVLKHCRRQSLAQSGAATTAKKK